MTNKKLIYVPSEVVIQNHDTDPMKYRRLEEPKVLLVLQEGDGTFEVLFEGESWVVKKNRTFSIEKQEEEK